MNLTVSIDDSGIDKLKLTLAAFQDQIPFATSMALNATAFKVKEAMKPATQQFFQSPVSYTQNAFRYTKSNKANLTATVFADPSRRYFPAEIFGGTRKWKPYEGLLRGLANGALPDGQLIPTKLVLNGAGNPKRSIFGTIQSNINATGQNSIFIGTPRGGGRLPGVYQRRGNKLAPLFLVASQPHYQPRFPMTEIGHRVIAETWPTALSAALDRALATSRR